MNLKKKKVFNTHATIKTKMIRFNNNVFMTKELRKQIIKRLHLRNEFNRNRNHENWCNFKFQRNYCVNLFKKTKKITLQKFKRQECNGQPKFLENLKTIFQQ